jgi:hypothetical protein
VSGENLEIARRIAEANHSGSPEETVERFVELVHPELEFRSVLSSVEGGTYRGPEGIRRYIADMGEAWEEWRTEVVEIEELSENTVLASFTTHAVGKGGFEGDLATFLMITIEDGKARRVISCPTREEALAAAGISE